MRRIVVCVVVALLVGISLGPAATADDPTKIDQHHGLTDDDAAQQWQSGGYVEGDVDRYDATIAVATDREDVADRPSITDFADWVRIDYNEEIERTLRIYIPQYVGQPYERAGVESITSDHTAKLQPVEGGKYLSIEIHVDGPAEIVLPLEWDGQVSYTILERVQSRLDRLNKYNPLAGKTDWQRVPSEELQNKGSVAVGPTSETWVVHVDARPDQPDHHWIPAPQQDADQPVFRHTVEENETQQTVVTSTVNDPPDVRYARETTVMGRIASQINSAREIPGEILKSLEVPDWVPGVGDG